MANKLTPAMQHVMQIVAQHGYVDLIRDGRKYRRTVDALIERGLLREFGWYRRGAGYRHYPTTTPEQVWDEAHAASTPVLNETITHITDQVTPWPGEAWVTHHSYGEQLHRSPDEAERWNAMQARLAAARPRSGDALADLRRAIHDVPDRSQRQALRAHAARIEAAFQGEPQPQVRFVGFTDEDGNAIRPWWLCPNTPPCPHGAALHDVEDLEDASPRCCFQGCACGRPSVPLY